MDSSSRQLDTNLLQGGVLQSGRAVGSGGHQVGQHDELFLDDRFDDDSSFFGAGVRAANCCCIRCAGVGQYGNPPRIRGFLLMTCTERRQVDLVGLQSVGAP